MNTYNFFDRNRILTAMVSILVLSTVFFMNGYSYDNKNLNSSHNSNNMNNIEPKNINSSYEMRIIPKNISGWIGEVGFIISDTNTTTIIQNKSVDQDSMNGLEEDASIIVPFKYNKNTSDSVNVCADQIIGEGYSCTEVSLVDNKTIFKVPLDFQNFTLKETMDDR